MISNVKWIVSSLVCLFLLTGFTYEPPIKAGGEIPWPLSTQRPVTVQNSKGLWKVGSKKKDMLFNVEMEYDSRTGFTFVRVAELEQKTLRVVSWGSSYFKPKKAKKLEVSPYFGPVLTPNPWGEGDKHAQYLHMYKNGDMKKKPYILRMVEVKTSVGNVLGLSMIKKERAEHFLGSRILKNPMVCHEYIWMEPVKLSCDFE